MKSMEKEPAGNNPEGIEYIKYQYSIPPGL
ncbi:MAG: hypothetical protein ACI9XO_003118 [Paraglaciecola sp.]|jgi:hypothetical protein